MLTRRSLLKQMALITGGSMLLNESFALNANNKKVGVQLYTVRNQIFKDPAGTLKKVAALGYQEVETFGYSGKFFGWTANEYKKSLADLNMAPVSGHYGYGKFADKNSTGSILHGWEKAVEDAATVGHQYMVLAYLTDQERTSLDDYKKVAADLNRAAEVCNKAGIQLCYHNHDFEFKKIDGILPMDILMKESDASLVKLELDLYWVSKAGLDPIAFIKEHKGRIPLWHVKDMDKTEKKFYTEVGNGVIDFNAIFKTAKTSGMKHFYVEQDECPGSPFDSLEKSINYIKSNLTKNL